MQRRALLNGLISSSVLTGLSGSVMASNEMAKLAYPPLWDATKDGKAELLAKEGATKFKGFMSSQTFGFNQNYLGPTIKMNATSEVEMKVRNTIREPISVHWHGLEIPGLVDGGPHQPIESGATWNLSLPINQPATTAWYHSHLHGSTARHVMKGLAGVIHLDDGTDAEVGLPHTYGEDDLTLVLQDKRFTWAGKMRYSPGMHARMNGFIGDEVLVNGQLGAVAEVAKGIVRLRLLNAANARIFVLAMSDGSPLHLIGTDGGHLDRTISLERLILSPGERAEVLVDLSDGVSRSLISYNVENSMMGTSFTSRSSLVLPFAVRGSSLAIYQKVPTLLNGSLPNYQSEPSAERRFVLQSGMGMMGRSPHKINNRSFDLTRLDFAARQNKLERWVVSGQPHSTMHPFHIHGTRFQVLSENGEAPLAQNRGWKDTIIIDGEVELLMEFKHAASQEAPYMYHCHILEHEDGGMMGQFSVV